MNKLEENVNVEGGLKKENAAVVLPPYTNRGVVFSVCLDWLTLSIPGIGASTWAAIRKELEWLHFEEAKDAVFGHGYTMKTCAGYGGIGYRVREGLIDGAVNLTGDALRHLAAIGIDNKTLLTRLCSVPGAHLTRIDIAIDVFCERVKVPLWWEKVKAKQYASRSRGKPRMAGDVDDVQTFYIGSKKSPRQLRIYNKTIEQLSKRVAGTPENWTRIELQHRDKAAIRVGETIITEGMSVIPSLVGGFFRMTNDAEWDAIVQGEIALGLPGRPVTSPQQKVRWITDQKSGIAKILKLTDLCDLTDGVENAKDSAEITDGDIERWVAAYKKDAL